MQNQLTQFSSFVSEVNARARTENAQCLAEWAVKELSDTVGFDCAWYGWAQLDNPTPTIHAQHSLNLPTHYYDSWREMSDQDLLAAAILKNPGRTAIYDRHGKNQNDGMISLSDSFGIKRMATAMHARPGRSSSFYLSSYRSNQHSQSWTEAELEFLQCAVDQLSNAMSKAVARDYSSDNTATRCTMFVNQNGLAVLGVKHALKHFGSFWPEWNGDQLPRHLYSLLAMPGEHILVDRELVVSCEQTPELHAMGLTRLGMRKLTKFDLLTSREQEVASLLAQGKSHKEAAQLLGVAPATVRNQTQSIYEKLGVRNRAGLVQKVGSGSQNS